MVLYAGYVISPLLENCFFVIHIIYACITYKKTNKEEIPLTFHSQIAWWSCKVTLTFESVDQIPWCDHSNQSSVPVLTLGAICLVCGSNFWVCGWNPMVLPFKWNFFGGTFTWYFTRWSLKFCWSLILATFGCERVNIVHCFCCDSP